MKFTKITRSSQEGTIPKYFPGWLEERYSGHYAQISTVGTLKLKSAILDVTRAMFGAVPPEVAALTKKMSVAPQGANDLEFILGWENDEGFHQGSIETDVALKEFIKKYPKQWDVVKMAISLPRSKGKHACAFLISNRSVGDFTPIVTTKDGKVTDFTGPDIEAIGGLKMDFLVVNQINDIQSCMGLIRERYMTPDERATSSFDEIPTKQGIKNIWLLPEDPAVFQDVSKSITETVFQFNTASAKKWLKYFDFTRPDGTPGINSIQAMAEFTALDRPGPLDYIVQDGEGLGTHNALVEYAKRLQGLPKSPDILPILEELVPETQGILIFQESLQRVYQELTGCTGGEAEEFRGNVAKKKKEKVDAAYKFFMERAGAKIGKEKAQGVWASLVSWAAYGFNCLYEDQKIKTLRGNVPIKEVTVKDLVATLQEDGSIIYVHPLWVKEMGRKEVFEVELFDGSKDVATEDHRFLYDEEWIELKELIFKGDIEIRKKNGCSIQQKIVNVRSLCIQPVWDMEIPKTHNFLLENGAVAHNCSHATAYSFISYACAYLKHHYNLEWWCGVLQNAKKTEIPTKFWPYCGIFTELPNLKEPVNNFTISGAKIKAPLSLLHGIGEAAHVQLCKYAPYSNIQDLADGIVKHRIATAENNVWGKSAITVGTIYTLAAAGLLDPLFDIKYTIPEIMDFYIKALKAACKKAGGKVSITKTKYKSPNELERYQLIKKTLPVYSIDFRGLVQHSKITKEEESLYYNYSYTNFKTNEEFSTKAVVISGVQFEELSETDYVPDNGYRVCVLAYVVDIEDKAYQNKTKQMRVFHLDACGFSCDVVKWPQKDGTMEPSVKAIEKGSVVVAILTRSPGWNFSINQIEVISGPVSKEEQ